MNKQQVEIALIILLIFLMYFQSEKINSFSKSALGKIFMIGTIILITQYFGKNAGIISALIMVLNLYNAHNIIESAKGKKEVKGKKLKEKKPKGPAPLPPHQHRHRHHIRRHLIAEELDKTAVELDKQVDYRKKFIKAYVKKQKQYEEEGLALEPEYAEKPLSKASIKRLDMLTIKHGKKRIGFRNFFPPISSNDILTQDRSLKKNAEHNKIAATGMHGGELYGSVEKPF